jgi:hypothetical protein
MPAYQFHISRLQMGHSKACRQGISMRGCLSDSIFPKPVHMSHFFQIIWGWPCTSSALQALPRTAPLRLQWQQCGGCAAMPAAGHLEGGGIICAGLGPGLGRQVEVGEGHWQPHCIEAELLLTEHYCLEVCYLHRENWSLSDCWHTAILPKGFL